MTAKVHDPHMSYTAVVGRTSISKRSACDRSWQANMLGFDGSLSSPTKGAAQNGFVPTPARRHNARNLSVYIHLECGVS
jgi:hypothetical protein